MSNNNTVEMDMEQLTAMMGGGAVNQPWNKLSKKIRSEMLVNYADKYGIENGLNSGEVDNLKQFFETCMSSSGDKFSKAKDVVYNKDKGEVVNVPFLEYDKQKGKFWVNNPEKSNANLLKSLTPKIVVKK